MNTLPELTIKIQGVITTNNLPQFKDAANTFIGAISTDLQTDDDFAQAENNVKLLADTEKKIEDAKQEALNQTVDIKQLLETLDEIKSAMRDKRLVLDKAVKTQKETIKAGLIESAKSELKTYVAAVEAEAIKPIKLLPINPDFNSAIKSKKTLDSMKKALADMLEAVKLEIDVKAQDIKFKLEWCKENADGYGKLFPDLQTIIHKDNDVFIELINNRIESFKREEQEKIIKAEQAAIAKAEQAAIDKARKAQDELIAQQKAAAEAAERAAELAERSQQGQAKAPDDLLTRPEVIETINGVTSLVHENRAPTTEQIIATLGETYQAPRVSVIEWLLAIDYDALSDELLS
jgi:hypothetical protein